MQKNGGGKQSYLATSRGEKREAHTILEYCFIDSLFSLLQSTSNVLTRSSSPSFLSIFPQFPRTEIRRHAHYNIILTDADIIHFI